MAMPLHITKIAFSSKSPQSLERWLTSHQDLGEARLTTRYKPKRADEMAGGSLYWILNSAFIGRSPILGFQDNGEGRYWICLKPELIPVVATPRRPHQGWRYLEEADAPADLPKSDNGLMAMPPDMIRELSRLALV